MIFSAKRVNIYLKNEIRYACYFTGAKDEEKCCFFLPLEKMEATTETFISIACVIDS